MVFLPLFGVLVVQLIAELAERAELVERDRPGARRVAQAVSLLLAGPCLAHSLSAANLTATHE